MPTDAHPTRVRRWAIGVGLVVSAGYAVGAAATTPFTGPADVMTAIPIAAVAVLAVVLWPARRDGGAASVEDGVPRPRHPYLGWGVLLVVVVTWELAEYLSPGSRGAHPTLSSMADAFDAHSIGKALAFLAWLLLGAAIVRAGIPAGSRRRASGAQPA